VRGESEVWNAECRMLGVGAWRFWDLEIGVGLTTSGAGEAAKGRDREKAGMWRVRSSGCSDARVSRWCGETRWGACGGGPVPVGNPTI